jgi:SpoVK/Ycf46/Vps4 family AAA+-type ATPase
MYTAILIPKLCNLRQIANISITTQTKLARAIAGEARSAFISVAPSDILSKFVGESEASVRSIFRKAVHEGLMCNSRSVVIFFDEIDALGQSRESKSSGEGEGCSRRVLSELLLLLNIVADNRECGIKDFNSCNEACKSTQDQHNKSVHASIAASDDKMVNIIVVAATNRIEDCDSALLRRFGIQLEVGLPAVNDRKKMLLRHLKDIEHTLGDEDLQIIAAMTDQWSGSTLESLAREACMRPIRECLHKAAVIRRRSEKREQRSGDVSGQLEDPESPDVAANSCLLESFQRLRPVTADDFRRAIETLTGEKISLTMSTIYGAAKRAKRSDEHYDSSSSSDGDEY